MLITSHILIRLLIQPYYFIDTRCELLAHCHGYNYHTDRALLFFITHYRVSNRSFDVRYTLAYLMHSSEYYYMNSYLLVLLGVWRVALAQGQCENLKLLGCNTGLHYPLFFTISRSSTICKSLSS